MLQVIPAPFLTFEKNGIKEMFSHAQYDGENVEEVPLGFRYSANFRRICRRMRITTDPRQETNT